MSVLHIALVGPGIQAIPPKGWGAVEILVWDYAQELRQLGHHVMIVNTPNRDAIVTQIENARPDFVHIQYDDFADVVPRILPFTRAVAITSHFGYLDQYERWGGYHETFRRLLPPGSQRVLYCALSPSIQQVYLRHGLPANQIYLNNNGANARLLRYTEQPRYGDRTICVGKIEMRKRQHVLQPISAVWFAGNRHGTEFDYNHPHYLGEWDKPTLFESLTDYGNLVLLSDGEADPLVVKEALVAGLGVVLSPWATANLDLSLPFITIVPLNRMDDVAYIREAIETNRTAALAQRPAIREYSQRFFWSNLVPPYVDLIRAAIQ